MRELPSIDGLTADEIRETYPTLERRFWQKVDVPESPAGCWRWSGCRRGAEEYGAIHIGGHTGALKLAAHRVSYGLHVGPLNPGLVIDHLCRNGLCVNPLHLELVPQAVNVYRGTCPTAFNRMKTHCKHGHEFTPENTYVVPSTGGRICRRCAADRHERYRRERSAVA